MKDVWNLCRMYDEEVNEPYDGILPLGDATVWEDDVWGQVKPCPATR